MAGYVKISSSWRTATSYYVKISSSWRNVSDGYVKISGAWSRFFQSALTPSIVSQVEISRNNATYPSTLTGTNYHWTNSTALTYVFQKSSDNVNFTNIGLATSIANPSSGSSTQVTYALTLPDFPAFTSYYRFVVTALNSTYSTSATSTSVTSVSVSRPAPINTVAPTISPSSGTVGVTQYSVTSDGTWDPVDADGVYQYLWQSSDNPPTNTVFISAPGTNTLSTYTPPSNFLSLGYSSPIRCRVTAVNASGSTAAFSNNATVSAVTPSASNLATSDTTLTPGTPSSITVANTATTNQGQVTWANGSNATSAWVSSVTPGSSFTGSDGGSLLTSQLFTITSSATAVATVNNKNNSKRVTISWDQSNAASYRVNYTITNAGLANGTYNEDGNSTASSASFIVTLGNVSGTVRANSVTVYSSSGQSGVSSTFTPVSAPQTSPTDKTSSNTGSGSVTFTVAVPAGGSVSISPGGTQVAGTLITATTTGWTNSPSSYNVRIYASSTNPPNTGSILKASSSGASSVSYTITEIDASPPAYYFKAFATATNAGGTSSEVGSNVVTSILAAPVNTSAPSVTPTSGTAGTTTYSSSTGTWTSSPTSYAYQWQYLDQGSTYLSISGATGSTYSPPSNFFSLGFSSPIRCRVTATNSGGSTSAFSNTASVSAGTTVPGTVNSLTASSLLSGSNLNWSASWSAPSSNGGAAITGYRVYVERAGSSSGPWIASTTQIPAGSGAYTAGSPYFTASTSVSGRVTSTAATWIRVWVAAVNSVGTGTYTSAIG